MTGLPLNLFLYPNFGQLLGVLVGEDSSDDGITVNLTELDIGPLGLVVVLRVNEDKVHLSIRNNKEPVSVGTCRLALRRLTERNPGARSTQVLLITFSASACRGCWPLL